MLLALVALIGASVEPLPNETVTVEADRVEAARLVAKKVSCTFSAPTGSRTSRIRVCMTGEQRARTRELTQSEITARSKDPHGYNYLNH